MQGIQRGLYPTEQYEWKEEKSRQDAWKMADAEVKVTEPANEVTMEARRLASVRVIDQQVEGFQSKRRAAAAQVDGRTKESKRGFEGCQGALEPKLLR